LLLRSYDEAVTRPKRRPPAKSRDMRRVFARTWPVLAVLATGALLAGCSGGGGGDIVVGQVGRADVKEIVEAPATVVAKASATVTTPANGTIANVRVKEGQEVTAGQVLLEIDSPEAEEQLEQAEKAHDEAMSGGNLNVPPADLSRTQAAIDRAATDAFKQAREAAEQIPDGPTRRAFLAQINQSQAAYAAVRADARDAVSRFNAGLGSISEALTSLSAVQRAQTEAAVALAQRTVDALTVRAPISGTVSFASPSAGAGGVGGLLSSLPEQAQGEASQLLGGTGQTQPGSGGQALPARNALTEGMPVSTGSTLLTILDVSDLSLSAEVDETDVLLVKPGVPADVELDAVPGASYAAEVETVDLAPTTSSGGGVSYVVHLSLDGGSTPDGAPAPEPRPGMSAVADLLVRTADNAVSVPSSAVVREGATDMVWLVTNGRAERRQVKLGAQGEDAVQVLQGVEVGDEVVVKGADQVSAGQSIS
jgi:multidrug efflux pump subunit AcrA (membrane-fusion protein)